MLWPTAFSGPRIYCFDYLIHLASKRYFGLQHPFVFPQEKPAKPFPNSSTFDHVYVLAKNLPCAQNLHLSKPGVLQPMRNAVLSYVIHVLQNVLQIFQKQYSLDYILSNLESCSIWVGNALTAHSVKNMIITLWVWRLQLPKFHSVIC